MHILKNIMKILIFRLLNRVARAAGTPQKPGAGGALRLRAWPWCGSVPEAGHHPAQRAIYPSETFTRM